MHDLPRALPQNPIDPYLFYRCFLSPPRGSAHGPSGWRMEDYALIAKHEVIADDGDAIASSTLYKAANAIYEGKVPKAFQPFWAGGRLIALVKPNGKLRPIVIGEALRRLVGSVVIKGHKSEAAVYFAPARNQGAEGAPRAPAQPVEAAQLGVGTEGGLEEIVHTVTIALQTHPFALDPNPNPNPNPARATVTPIQ